MAGNPYLQLHIPVVEERLFQPFQVKTQLDGAGSLRRSKLHLCTADAARAGDIYESRASLRVHCHGVVGIGDFDDSGGL